MIILVCNDDGIRSEGIQALARALEPLGDVFVVAPDREQSAAGHSLTLHRPLRVEEVAPRQFAIDGTPTDCVNLAVSGILADTSWAWSCPGINKGANLGDDITYSGTVSAAMEGTLLGIPSVADLARGSHARSTSGRRPSSRRGWSHRCSSGVCRRIRCSTSTCRIGRARR